MVKRLVSEDVSMVSSDLVDKSHTQKKPRVRGRDDANKINAWSGNEINLGELDKDLKDIIARVKSGGLKGRRVGSDYED